MKKLISLMIALLLTLTLACPALAESDVLTMEGSLVVAMEMPVASWVADENSQAMFVALAMLDCVLSGDDRASEVSTDALLNGVTYVGYNEESVSCYIFGLNTCLTYTYAPATGPSAVFTPMGEADAAAMMAAIQTETPMMGCSELSVDLVLAMMQMLMGALVQ